MKNVFTTICDSLSNAVEYVVEKNRKTAQINRLKLVIRSEERIAEKAYIALGKYYYHHLRDDMDLVTEPHCVAIDHASQRLDRAITRLEDLCAAPDCTEEDCASCGFDCSCCDADDFDDDCECAAEEAPAQDAAQETEPPQQEEAPTQEEQAPAKESPVEEPSQPAEEEVFYEAADPRDNQDIPFI